MSAQSPLVHTRWRVSEARGQVRIAYDTGAGAPQYVALHLKDSYLRLNHGPGAGWGTSVILMPVYWSAGCCQHGARVRAACELSADSLVIRLCGELGGLQVALRVELAPPQGTGSEVQGIAARVVGRATGRPTLDVRPGEAFKPVMLSSMRIAVDQWDAQAATADDRVLTIPEAGWIAAPPDIHGAHTLGLLGGTSLWKREAPTIRVTLDEPLPVTGWVTRSSDPNDDNVGFWAASDHVLDRWSYTVEALHPDAPPPTAQPN